MLQHIIIIVLVLTKSNIKLRCCSTGADIGIKQLNKCSNKDFIDSMYYCNSKEYMCTHFARFTSLRNICVHILFVWNSKMILDFFDTVFSYNFLGEKHKEKYLFETDHCSAVFRFCYFSESIQVSSPYPMVQGRLHHHRLECQTNLCLLQNL